MQRTKALLQHKGFLGSVFAFSLILIFLNEYSAIQKVKAQKDEYYEIQTIASDYIDEANEGVLVHTQGRLTAEGELRDDLFGVSVPAVRMRRTLQMYQWREKIQDITSTGSQDASQVALYEKVWSPVIIDSKTFRQADTHFNPLAFPYQRAARNAANIKIGVFDVDDAFIDALEAYQPYPFVLEAPEGFVLRDGVLYSGNPDFPQIGDVQVGFEIIQSHDVSIIAAQSDKGLVPYIDSETEKTVGVIKSGTLSIRQMGMNELETKSLRTWVLRVFAFLLVFWFFHSVKRSVFHVLQKVPAFSRYAHVSTDVVIAFVSLQIVLVCIAAMWMRWYPLTVLIILIPALAVVVSHYVFLSDDERLR